jgi:hypothetical protein
MKHEYVSDDDDLISILTKKRKRGSSSLSSQVIIINAGGVIHHTTLDTLTKSFPGSRISEMFRYVNNNDDADAYSLPPMDRDGHFFIDTKPELFCHIINVLRRPCTVNDIPNDIDKETWIKELHYWRINHTIKMDNGDDNLLIDKRKNLDYCVMDILMSLRQYRNGISDGNDHIKIYLPYSDCKWCFHSDTKINSEFKRVPKEIATGEDVFSMISYIHHASDRIRKYTKFNINRIHVDLNVSSAKLYKHSYMIGNDTYDTTQHPSASIGIYMR